MVSYPMANQGETSEQLTKELREINSLSLSKNNIHIQILREYSLEELKSFVETNKGSDTYYNSEVENDNSEWTRSQQEVLQSVSEHLKVQREPFRGILCGVAGSGKSKLISEVRRKYESQGYKVIVTAPFGYAAALVDGCTIHSLLSLHYKSTNFSFLAKKVKLNRKVVEKLDNCKLIIVDEFLTAGAGLFHYFSDVVSCSRKSNEPFADLDILLAGDFCQIPPPAQTSLLSNPEFASSYSAEGINIYRSFNRVFYLEETLRAPDDPVLNKLLFNLRRKKVTQEDVKVISTRCQANLSKEEVSLFVNSTFIFPRNVHSRQHNFERVKELGQKLYDLTPIQTPPEPIQFSKEDCFPIAIGARVKLKRNLDLRGRILSGSVGYLEGILFERGEEYPSVLLIRFDGCLAKTIHGLIPITRSSEYVRDPKTGQSFKLNIFPIVLCFAISTHGCQGQTLEKACVFLDHKEFFPNSCYVSLSRTRRLSDVMILDEEVKLERFTSYAFFRGFADQLKEFHRLGIADKAFKDVLE